MNPNSFLPFIASPVAGVLLSSDLQAAIMYGTAGASYTQNFDSLPAASHGDQVAWANGTTLDGWHWADPDGATRTTYTVLDQGGGGTANQQNYPIFVGNSTDRAFGGQGSSDSIDNASDQFIRYGLQLTNTTGVTLTEFTLSFTAEQWRAITDELADQLTFDYKVGADSISGDTGWTDVAAFTFDAPNTTTSSQWYDGNAAANREVFSETITGVNWGAGEDLWLRWNDVGGTGNVGVDPQDGFKRAIMGIDDLTFTASAVPEPSSAALLMGLSVGALLVTRRRRC